MPKVSLYHPVITPPGVILVGVVDVEFGTSNVVKLPPRERRKPCVTPLASKQDPMISPVEVMALGTVNVESGASNTTKVGCDGTNGL